MTNFTNKSQEALQRAYHLAAEHGHQQIEAGHLLAALLLQEASIVIPILKRLEIPTTKLKSSVSELLETYPRVAGGGAAQIYLSQSMGDVMKRAEAEAANMKDEYISTEHLFLALTDVTSPAQKLLNTIGVNYADVLRVLVDVRGNQRVTDAEPESKFQALEKYAKNLTALARQNKLDPVIGRDDEIRRVMQVLSRRTKNNPVLIGEAGTGKTAIAEGLAQRIASGDVPETLKDKELVALDLGSLLAGAKFRGEFEDRLKAVLRDIDSAAGKILLFIDELHTLVGAGAAEGAIDAANMLKPALARGELHAIGATTLSEYQRFIEKDAALERRFQPVYVGEPSIEDTIAILRGLKERYEIHHGVRITDAAVVAAAELSHRYVTERFLPDKAIDLIDEAASALRMEIDSLPTELDKLERKIRQLEIEREALKKETDATSQARLTTLEAELASLKERSNQLSIHWKSEKETIGKIRAAKKRVDELRQEAESAERNSEFQRVAEIRYGEIPARETEIKTHEGQLFDLEKETGQRILKEEVMAEDIASVVARWTGIPVEKMLEAESEKLVRAEAELSKRVVGQRDAISAVANALRRSRAGIGEEGRPIGSFLFVGPTGVGKTELARALATFMFNDEQAVIRVDMSEYMERHSAAKFIGSPPGYVGYEEGGQLTEKIRRRPYAVVLFDEIEKAHEDVFNLLLQILEDGRLTDARGRTANFKNTIIIMTSNLGNSLIEEFNLGFEGNKISVAKAREEQLIEQVQLAVRNHFKPEFINRIDDIVVFHHLSKADMEHIIDLQLELVSKRLQAKAIVITVSEKAKQHLMEQSYSIEFGARPLKRAIQSTILDEIARRIVSGELPAGSQVLVDNDKNGFTFKVTTAKKTKRRTTTK
ncbi:MAG: ATP-dependent chaperone ClpB [Patescibacteria group bacterium]